VGRTRRAAGSLVRACHPGPTVAVTAIAVLLGIGFALTTAELLLVGVTVLTGQLSIGWSNDWLDAPVDTQAGRGDKPAARGDIGVPTLRVAASAALVLTVPLSMAAGWRAGTAHLVLVASGWVYNLGLKRNLWSPLPYATGFGALPVYVALVGDVQVTWWIPTTGAMLGVAAHFANAAPDVAVDRAGDIWGLPQRVGTRAALVIALGLLAAAGLLAMAELAPQRAAWWLVVIVPPALGLWLVARSSGRAVFVVVMVAAVLDVIALVAAV
jgi:4-hydroxybenzoate polyprenyltransferase